MSVVTAPANAGQMSVRIVRWLLPTRIGLFCGDQSKSNKSLKNPSRFFFFLVVPVVVMPTRDGWWTMLSMDWRRNRLARTFNNFVEFTPIKPDSPTFRAIVDLNIVALRHGQRRVSTMRTFHDVNPWVLFEWVDVMTTSSRKSFHVVSLTCKAMAVVPPRIYLIILLRQMIYFHFEFFLFVLKILLLQYVWRY